MQSKMKQAQHSLTWGTSFPTPQTDISCSFLLPSANMRVVILRLMKGKIKHCRAQTINNHQTLKANVRDACS